MKFNQNMFPLSDYIALLIFLILVSLFLYFTNDKHRNKNPNDTKNNISIRPSDKLSKISFYKVTNCNHNTQINYRLK